MHSGLNLIEFAPTSSDPKYNDVDMADQDTLTSEDINKLENVKNLVQECLGERPNITLTNRKSNPYASCIPGKVILWDQNEFRNEKLIKVIFWTIFEQLNVQSYKNINEIIRKFEKDELTLDNAVIQIEKLEYGNTLRAKAAMIEAIANKKLDFMTESLPEVPIDFSLHYRIQQLTSHSQRIAKRISQCCSQTGKSHSYTGTWKIKLDAISEVQKKALGGLLQLKREMENEAQYNAALLKLGCNLIYNASRHSEEKSTSFLQEAAEEIFTQKELALAHAQADQYLSKARAV